MKWIGLTGGIACGKSTVSQLLVQQSYPIVDADQIARDVVAPGTPGLESVIQAFGPEMLSADGSLDRGKLGAKIFSQAELRRKLEGLLHPLIRTEVQRRREELEKQGVAIAFYDVPLLFETKSQGQFDEIVVVTCRPEQQRERLRARNKWSEEEIEKRLSSQMPLALKEEQANFVVRNDGDQAHLQQEFQRLLEWLKTLSV